MLDTIFGLPVHPLIVHATTVVVPAAAVTVLLCAVWPRFRRWAAWMPLALSVLAVVLTPLSTESGESLERHVEHSDLIETHSQLAEGLLPWVIGLAAAAVLLFVVARGERRAVPTVTPSDSAADPTDETPARTSLVPRCSSSPARSSASWRPSGRPCRSCASATAARRPPGPTPCPRPRRRPAATTATEDAAVVRAAAGHGHPSRPFGPA